MSNQNHLNLHPDSIPPMYQIRIKGHLGEQWNDWFGTLSSITLEEDGVTCLTGNVDQAALHGLLKKIRDLGIPLLSVNRLKANQENETKKM